MTMCNGPPPLSTKKCLCIATNQSLNMMAAFVLFFSGQEMFYQVQKIPVDLTRNAVSL